MSSDADVDARLFHRLHGRWPDGYTPPADEPEPPPHPLDPRSSRSFVRNGPPETNERTQRTHFQAAWTRGGSLMAANHPPLCWHVEPVFTEGLNVFAGAPKVGKSWMLQDIALAVSTGGKVLGVRVQQRPVLHLALEDSERRLQARARVLGYHDSGDLLDDWYAVTRLTGEPIREVVTRWMAQLPADSPPPLTILDTWGRAKGPRPMSMSPYDWDYAVGVALKDTADLVAGGALIAAHHDRKADSPDFVDSLSGTHGIGGSADTIVVLRRDRIQTNGVMLVTGRDVQEASYAVSFDAGRWTLIGDDWQAARAAAAQVAATVGRGETTAQVVTFIAAHGPSNVATIADALELSADAVRMALTRLLDADLIVRPKRGVYALPALDFNQVEPDGE